jgi:hypothetical protein
MKSLHCLALAAGIAALACGGCGKKEDPVKVIEEAEANLPPQERVEPPAPAPGVPVAPAPARTPAATAATPPADAAYEAWFRKHQLDLTDSQMLDADPDGDGVSNRDEFLADTDPRNPNSRPGTHQQLRLKQYTEVRVPLLLEEVRGETARVRRLDGPERTEEVRAGQPIAGLRWKVEKVQSRQDLDKNGAPVDFSSITLTDTETNERTTLVKNLPTRTADTAAELVSEGGAQTINVKEGETFEWPEGSGAHYKVIDLRADQVVVQEVATKKMWTIQK